jgi:ParB/RepB/Spo0J family partition protein
MTSGTFKSVLISSIIDRDEDQRAELTNIEELAESIHRIGLIHPIVINPSSVLVAGKRRLTACRSLGWTSIPVQFTTELSEYELQCIELEENIKRVDLPWQDQCFAIARFHKLKTDERGRLVAGKNRPGPRLVQLQSRKHLSVAAENSPPEMRKSPMRISFP